MRSGAEQALDRRLQTSALGRKTPDCATRTTFSGILVAASDAFARLHPLSLSTCCRDARDVFEIRGSE